jgi:esterase/lipase superfamily enzyme
MRVVIHFFATAILLTAVISAGSCSRSAAPKPSPLPPTPSTSSAGSAKHPTKASAPPPRITGADETHKGGVGAAPPAAPAPLHVRTVYFGTDRKSNPGTAPREFFGAERGEALVVGTCRVSVPTTHSPGHIERPLHIFSLELPEDPDKHFILRDVTPLPDVNFYQQLHDATNETNSKELMIFVHGFDVSFEDAAYRTAQLTFDIGFTGTTAMYSWPSQGDPKKYTYDEASIDGTVEHLTTFLRNVIGHSGAAKVHVIAHSMGSRALVRAMRDLGSTWREPPDHPWIDQAIVAAPDIDRDEFVNALPRLNKAMARLTMYASSEDRALMASRTVHGFSRAGEGGDYLVVAAGLDTVDASGIDTSMLGHSYYGDCEKVLLDLRQLLQGAPPPRGMQRYQKNSIDYWAIKK